MFAKHYAKYYELFNQDKPYKKEIGFVYKWAENPRRILDIGCGTAHYWDYYPDGAVVVGIEKSKDMMSRSRNQGVIFQRDIQKGEFFGKDFDLVTALFDVVNYLPNLRCFKTIPVKKGGYFIFDLWDKEKVDREGFKETFKTIDGATRTIKPLSYDGRKVELEINIDDKGLKFTEVHQMYVYTHKEIELFCGTDFDIAEVKKTKSWQIWYKLRKK